MGAQQRCPRREPALQLIHECTSSFNVSQIPKNIAYDLIGAIPSVTSARRRFTESVLHLLQYELNSKFFGPKSERMNNAMDA